MSMSDCPKCWSTPCECGHDYDHRSIEWLEVQRDMFDRIISQRKTELKESKNDESRIR